MTERTIRAMELRDIPRILEIERVSFLTPWTEGMFRSQLRFKDRSINLVAVESEAIAGYAAAWIAYDEIHLLSIAVDPAMRRGGIGSEILRAVIASGGAQGGRSVILEVREGNTAARSFYRKHGFLEIGRRGRYYSDTGEDAILMEHLFVE